MPSTYTHTCFGARVLTLLPLKIRCTMEAYRSLYDVGLQGPDVLFHYKALKKNPINELGRAMHRWSGKRFFASIVDKAQDDAAKAYLCGVLCHFALDSTCHSAVNASAARADVHHFDVETELDRTMMLRDGLDPVTFHPTAHFMASTDLCRVMADFYGIAPREAKAAVKGMKNNIDLLVPRNALWRGFVGGVLKAVHASAFYRLIIPKCAPQGLPEEMPHLVELNEQAEAVAQRLILAFFDGTLLDDEQLLLDFATGKKVEEKQ